MKKNERLLENKVRALIKMLREAEENSGAAGAEEFEPQPEPMIGVPKAKPQQQAQTQAQSQGQPLPKATNLKYLSTIDMFTTNYPPNSAEWTQEIGKKPQFRPLQDGRVVNFLKKQFPTLKVRRAAAARYSDIQFRVILYGDLKAPTVLKVQTTGPKKVIVSLDSIKIDNRFTSPAGDVAIIEAIKAKKIALPGIDLKQLTDWTGITPEGEPEPEKEKAKVAATEEPKEQEAGTEEAAPEKSQGQDQLSDILVNRMGYSKTAADAAAREALKGLSPESDEDWQKVITRAIQLAAKAPAEKKPKPVKPENASLDLHKYLKNLLIEKKSGELEHGLGGEILAAINDEVMDEWFGDDGLAATTSKRLFKGKGFEWFAAESATFVPERRIVDKVEEGKQIQITLNGYFVIESEIWIDARIEGQGLLDSWSFRILGQGAQVLNKILRTPGIISKMPKTPETT